MSGLIAHRLEKEEEEEEAVNERRREGKCYWLFKIMPTSQ